MNFTNFDREAVIQIASEGYSTKLCFDNSSFKKDVFTFFIVRKMIKRFLQKGIINEKLILNNIIICLNVFRNSKNK